ncbi:hypothetical protein GCM10009665_74920 [Kitasatospora nipponensis]|uniref:DUF3592 domain-containing protein n=1 Tax=Kitasatospora nipponensis TaxID=258049 RepID=A0ABN1T7X8_9ACTN
MGEYDQDALLLCWWTGLLLLVLGVPAVALRLSRFSRHGTTVQGTVTRMLVRRNGRRTSVVPVVRFTDAATEREVTGTPTGGRIPQVGWPGQLISVRYLPGAPDLFQVGPQISLFDAGRASLLVMTLGSVALVLTRWTDPDAIATSAVLACSSFALTATAVMLRHSSTTEQRRLLRDKGVVAYGRLIGTVVAEGGPDSTHRYHPVLRFTTADGEQVTGADLSTSSRRRYPVGGPPVPVRHLPQDPTLFRLDAVGGLPGARSGRGDWHRALAVVVFCGVLITVGASLAVR